MARKAQAFGRVDWLVAKPPAAALVLCAALVLSACASGGGMTDIGVDDTLTTASLPQDEISQPDQTRRSDEVTIRNAVTSADLGATTAAGLSWANADTGSRGAITGLAEAKRQGVLCRSFRASRESYDGVAVFSGETCLASEGWKLVRFDEI